MTGSAKLADILLVEDNDDDVYLTRMAFEDSAFDSAIHVVNDGEKALDFLYRRGDYSNCPVPDLVPSHGPEVRRASSDSPSQVRVRNFLTRSFNIP